MPDTAHPNADHADSLIMSFDVSVGFNASSAWLTLPELAIIGSDGRRTGFDPATRHNVAGLPGAYYESGPTLDNDDAPPDTTAGPPPELLIDVRTLHVSAHDSTRYTLEVAADSGGSFSLQVVLHARRGNGSRAIKARSWKDSDFVLRRGEVRRLLVRVRSDAMEVLPDSSAASPSRNP